MSVALQGWHPGERSIQERLNYAGPMAMAYTWIDAYMPEQHRTFHSKNLPFVPLTTLDGQGRPWSCIAAGVSGKPGFISSPSETELVMDVKSWQGDPLLENLDAAFEGSKKALIAGIGIEFSTRRRNKFAGSVVEVTNTGPLARKLRVNVNQTIGNCPKYINVRDLIPHPHTTPKVVYRQSHMTDSDRLPADVISFITQSDTVFLGSSYEAAEENARKFPSHVGMNQRGGRPGYIRVLPSDGRTIVHPDYSGNRLLTSLGNIEANPLASLTFVDFETGNVLYLTCDRATNLVGEYAKAIMPRQNVLTTFRATGFVFVSDALPVRQRPRSNVERSPYSPPVKLLAEELTSATGSQGGLGDVTATVTRMQLLSPNHARFTFETSKSVSILPGQAAILDFSDLLGAQEYAHMAAPGSEASLNDDRIRTWTVSSAHIGGETSNFELTMRLKEGGLVTGALFAIARHAQAKMPRLMEDTKELGLTAGLVGISGEFTFAIPPSNENADGRNKRKLLWIAGGIGVTPFLSMLSAIASSPSSDWDGIDIVLILSTREPELLLGLINESMSSSGYTTGRSRVKLHIFTNESFSSEITSSNLILHVHRGQRFGREAFEQIALPDIKSRTAFVCGPPAFEKMALQILDEAGLTSSEIHKEGFGY